MKASLPREMTMPRRRMITMHSIPAGTVRYVITHEVDHSYRVWHTTPRMQLTACAQATFWTYGAAVERLQDEVRQALQGEKT